jgi:hypothetical protein
MAIRGTTAVSACRIAPSTVVPLTCDAEKRQRSIKPQEDFKRLEERDEFKSRSRLPKSKSNYLPISMLQMRRRIETRMISAVGRGIQGERRRMSRMMLGPIRLETRASQQFGSRGSYAVLAGFDGSGSSVQGRNLFGSPFVRRSLL